MDFVEKAKIRMEHWMTHNDHHHEEYQMFAEQLEDAGKTKSAAQIREMIHLSSRMNDCLRNAMKEIGE
jgi:hypothetical protein